jgi:hypothetical protein
MTLLNAHPDPEGLVPKYDGNTIKWSGYFATTEQAQKHLEDKAKHFANTENKLVVSAKKDFVNRHFKGYFLFRFTLKLAYK